MMTLFWLGAVVPPEARAAFEQLGRNESSIEERRAALLELLASDSVVARGLALDYFSRSTAELRWGDNPLIEAAVVEAAARAAALRELAAPPYESTDPEPNPQRGANHASALHVLRNYAEAADAPLVARVLHETDELGVLYEGVIAAEAVLQGKPAHPELVDVLSQTAQRRELDPQTRAGAIQAIGGTADEVVTPLLVASLADPELGVSVAAAQCLLARDFERHRALVASAAAAWQPDETRLWVVHEVRRLLKDTPEAG